MIISNDIVKKVFLNLDGSNLNGKSLYVVERQLNLETYEVQQAVKKMKELDLIKTIDSATKSHPYDQILLLKPKGKYYMKHKSELEKIFFGSKNDAKPTNKKEPLKTEIQELVSSGETKKALDLLISITQGQEKNQALTLSSSYNILRKRRNSGILKYEDERLELNRINNSILDIADLSFVENKNYAELLVSKLNEINPEIINQVRLNERHINVFINQDNYNDLIKLQVDQNEKLVNISNTKDTTTITTDKLRITYYIYDKKYGYALGCILSISEEFKSKIVK